MLLALRGLPVLLEIGLLIFCLIDCIQTPEDEVRGLAKLWWILLIVVLPLIGGIAWLVAGRPSRPRHAARWPVGQGFPEFQRPAAPRGPDDDPDFLAQLDRGDTEHEETLRKWEADLRRREEEQRRRESGEA